MSARKPVVPQEEIVRAALALGELLAAFSVAWTEWNRAHPEEDADGGERPHFEAMVSPVLKQMHAAREVLMDLARASYDGASSAFALPPKDDGADVPALSGEVSL